MQDSTNVADELLRHQTWVRRLAEVLVPDPAGADDVVQETWRQVLERPPEEVRHPRAWLAAVVRGTARRRVRGEARRRRREAAVAHPEAQASLEELASRARLQRDLVDAILELGDETRDTLLARYFDDLPPREIARRLGVPVATVKSRIQRGLERLRERLDAEYGDRRQWSAVLLPLVGKSVPATIPAATMGWLLSGALLALATVGAWALLGTPRGAPVPHELPATLVPDLAGSESTDAPSSVAESLVATAPPARTPVDEPHVLVLDAAGAHVVGANVRYARVDAPGSGTATTDERGRVELPAPGDYLLAVAPASGTGLAELRSVDTTGTTLRLPRQGSLEVRFVDAAGRGVSDVEVQLLNPDVGTRLRRPASWVEFLEPLLAGTSAIPPENVARAWELARRDAEDRSGRRALTALQRAVVLAWPQVEARRTSGADGSLRWDGLPPSTSWEVQVTSGHLLPEPEHLRGVEVFADGSSRVDFTALPPGNTSSSMHVTAGEETVVELALLRQAAVHGALDPGSTSWNAPPRLVLRHFDGSDLGGLNGDEDREATVGEDGTFSFHAVRPGRKVLTCSWIDGEGRTRIVHERIELRAGESLDLGLLAAREGRDVRVRIGLRGPDGEVLEPGLVTRGGGRGRRSSRPTSSLLVVVHDEDGREPVDASRNLAPWPGEELLLTGLPAGEELELRLRLHQFEVAAGYRLEKAFVDVRAPFPEDGVMDLNLVLQRLVAFHLRVAAEAPGADVPADLRVKLDGPTPTSVQVDGSSAVEVHAAPGRYRAAARTRGSVVPGSWCERELDVRGGETFELLLAPAAGFRGTARPESMVHVAYGDRIPGRRESFDAVTSARVDAEGAFRVGGLAPNRSYVLRAGDLVAVARTGEAGSVLEVELL